MSRKARNTAPIRYIDGLLALLTLGTTYTGQPRIYTITLLLTVADIAACSAAETTYIILYTISLTLIPRLCRFGLQVGQRLAATADSAESLLDSWCYHRLNSSGGDLSIGLNETVRCPIRVVASVADVTSARTVITADAVWPTT